MKQAKIFYHYDDGIIIDGFKNVLKRDSLPTEYLVIGLPYFYLMNDGKAIMLGKGDSWSTVWYIPIGAKLSISEWKRLKSNLKRAGKRLSEIRRNVKTEEFKDKGVIIKHYSRGKKEIITDIIVKGKKVDFEKKHIPVLTPYEAIVGRGTEPNTLWVSSDDYFAYYLNGVLQEITFSKDGTFFAVGSPTCTFKMISDKEEFKETVRCLKSNPRRKEWFI